MRQPHTLRLLEKTEAVRLSQHTKGKNLQDIQSDPWDGLQITPPNPPTVNLNVNKTNIFILYISPLLEPALQVIPTFLHN